MSFLPSNETKPSSSAVLVVEPSVVGLVADPLSDDCAVAWLPTKLIAVNRQAKIANRESSILISVEMIL